MCMGCVEDIPFKVTPEMVEAGYAEFLGERFRIEGGELKDRQIAFTLIFQAMARACKVTAEDHNA